MKPFNALQNITPEYKRLGTNFLNNSQKKEFGIYFSVGWLVGWFVGIN